ncbi:Retrovirus-related Pol polyprotein from transposon RE2 [Vitis vinifera]|uniref:Retrovirus-related Pol polyprotein from transposon RE2 n=1 Tax=Vitis vinifera TaxID=29760 RepID=A0A438IME4_VITVI|nr:Retrovirus-related Pol polyprotein from transposon RE2 [Vitis vinifera]
MSLFVKNFLNACIGKFEMSMMGELNFFLGLQIKQLKEGTFINQAKYIRDLLKGSIWRKPKTMKTPMSSSIKLDMDEKGKSVNSTMYRGVIGSLLYLTASRPDIMYSGFNLKPRVFSLRSVFSLYRAPQAWFSFISMRLGLRGKRPTEPSQPEQTETRRKARYDTGLFNSVEDYQRYKQKFAQRKVVPGRSINFSQLQHFVFEGLFSRMGMATSRDDF